MDIPLTNMQPVPPIKSKPDTLVSADWILWGKETFIFLIPTVVAFLLTYQLKGDYKYAIGSAYTALAASLMNLYGKYKATN